MSKIDLTTTLFGRKLRLPVILAPVGSLESFDPGGAATAGARPRRSACRSCVSSVTHPGLEEIAAATPGPKIFQLYVRGDKAWIDDVVKRAVDDGYDAFAITVDTAAYSRRERDIAGRFVKPWRAVATGHTFQAGFTWDNVKHFKDKHSIPLILKGIATAEDAALCCEHGVDGVYVSNHGGRQLDHGRGSMDVLPEVMAAVRGRAKVMIDGSFCRGTDIVKAIALGRRRGGDGADVLLRAGGGRRCRRAQDAGTAGARVRRRDGAVRRSIAERTASRLRVPRCADRAAAASAQRVPAAADDAGISRLILAFGMERGRRTLR